MSSFFGEEIFNIGGRLKEERELLGLSQEALGARLATTGRTIKKYEGNETSIRATELLQLSGLGADVLYIVTGSRLPLAVSCPGSNYTPAEQVGAFIAELTLSDEDVELLKTMALRLSRSE